MHQFAELPESANGRRIVSCNFPDSGHREVAHHSRPKTDLRTGPTAAKSIRTVPLTTFAPLTVSVNEADLFGSNEHVPCSVLRNPNTSKGHISRRIKKGPTAI
jgi:hypothetical protein